MILGSPKGPNLEAQKGNRSIRILKGMASGIPLVLSLGARMCNPSVYVVFWSPKSGTPRVVARVLGTFLRE